MHKFPSSTAVLPFPVVRDINSYFEILIFLWCLNFYDKLVNLHDISFAEEIGVLGCNQQKRGKNIQLFWGHQLCSKRKFIKVQVKKF